MGEAQETENENVSNQMRTLRTMSTNSKTWNKSRSLRDMVLNPFRKQKPAKSKASLSTVSFETDDGLVEPLKPEPVENPNENLKVKLLVLEKQVMELSAKNEHLSAQLEQNTQMLSLYKDSETELKDTKLKLEKLSYQYDKLKTQSTSFVVFSFACLTFLGFKLKQL